MNRVLAQTYLGNVGEVDELAARVAKATDEGRCLSVEIERSDCSKGRILTHTTSGQPVGIVKDRDWQLREGDVLLTMQESLVVVQLQSQELMALRFSSDTNNTAAALIQLGYALGNQHWPTTVRGDVVYVEMVAARSLMEKTVNEIAIALNIKGLQITFEAKSAEEVVEFQHVHHTHN